MIKKDVPFYSQKWDLENWGELGFRNIGDAQYWEKSSCGILCLKMALDSGGLVNLSMSIAEYIKKGCEIGAYSDRFGWSHHGLADLAKFLGAEAVVNTRARAADIKRVISTGYIVIVSIKWAFENTKSLKEKLLFWKKYGGALSSHCWF